MYYILDTIYTQCLKSFKKVHRFKYTLILKSQGNPNLKKKFRNYFLFFRSLCDTVDAHASCKSSQAPLCTSLYLEDSIVNYTT